MTCTTALITAFGAALAAGDTDRVGSLLGEDVAYQVPGRSSAAGVHLGRDEVVARLTAPAGAATQVDDVEVTESMVDGQRGMVIVLMRGATSGSLFAVETALHLQTDGELIIGISEYSGDQHLMDSLLSDATDGACQAKAVRRSARWWRRTP
ncbi:MAG: nuclear transport factor 2 family protein [Ilumatobacter sp.]